MAYYVLFGINGTIIQENYYKTLRCQEYIKKSTMKKFSTFEEAEQAALDHLAAILPYYIPIPNRIELNDMITKNKLYRASKGGPV
jgi:hypothetical protein